jgi:hypothetical protein
MHQKECGKVWGARYTLGARYLSKNTSLCNMCISKHGYKWGGPYIIGNTAAHNHHPHCPIITTVIICLSGVQYFIVNRYWLWCYVVSASVDRQAVRSLYPIRYQENGHDGLKCRPGGNAVRVLR